MTGDGSRKDVATVESGCLWLGHDASWGRGWGFLASWGVCPGTGQLSLQNPGTRAMGH